MTSAERNTLRRLVDRAVRASIVTGGLCVSCLMPRGDRPRYCSEKCRKLYFAGTDKGRAAKNANQRKLAAERRQLAAR